MLLDHWDSICKGFLWVTLFIIVCALYAYRLNARRPVDDPKKRDFHPVALLLVPFTWPVLLLAWIAYFLLRALSYGIFLVLFAIALLVFRKPFLLVWLDKIARKVGDAFLEVNTFLIRITYGAWRKIAGPI